MRDHTPNSISRGDRIAYTVFSILLFAYGSYGVWVNALYIPGRRTAGTYFHDIPAWIMYGAIVCACLVMLSVVVDHYDRRPNERHYRTFAQAGKYLGWGLVAASMLSRLFQ